MPYSATASNRGQTVLVVLLLIVVLGLIALIAYGIKTGKIVINPEGATSSQVVPEDLQKLQKELMAKEKELKELEERLKIQQESLNREKEAFLKQMNEVLGKLGPQEAKEKKEGTAPEQTEEERLRYLAKLYGGMKPEAVARIFKEMDSATVAQIISRMGNRQASKVMSALPADKAIEITRLLKEGKVK